MLLNLSYKNLKTMNKFLESKLKKVEDFIKATNDVNLFDANFVEDLYGIYKETAPQLDKDKHTKSIEREIITDDNLPNDVKYKKGEVMDFVIVRVPVVGITDYFKQRYPELFDVTKTLFINNDALFFKQFSETDITDNPVAIALINDKAAEAFADFDIKLIDFSVEVSNYNAELLELINTNSNKERLLRTVKENSEDLINPFDGNTMI